MAFPADLFLAALVNAALMTRKGVLWVSTGCPRACAISRYFTRRSAIGR
jgi:hypothetical protein